MTQPGTFAAGDFLRADAITWRVHTPSGGEKTAAGKNKIVGESGRMNIIIDQLISGTLLVASESVATTNEREGSEIDCQVICALTEVAPGSCSSRRLHDLAGRSHKQHAAAMVFLRAERHDGNRIFRLTKVSQPASYGKDLHQAVFGTADLTAPA